MNVPVEDGRSSRGHTCGERDKERHVSLQDRVCIYPKSKYMKNLRKVLVYETVEALIAAQRF